MGLRPLLTNSNCSALSRSCNRHHLHQRRQQQHDQLRREEVCLAFVFVFRPDLFGSVSTYAAAWQGPRMPACPTTFLTCMGTMTASY